MDSSRQERESSDAEWDARHQEAVDSAEQWKAFADKLTKEKEEQQQQLASASSELQVELMCLLLHFRVPEASQFVFIYYLTVWGT